MSSSLLVLGLALLLLGAPPRAEPASFWLPPSRYTAQPTPGWPNGYGDPDRDTDGDGIPDADDPDADGDGIPDLLDGLGDADCDGLQNYLDAHDQDGPCGDPDGDGLDNEAEAACGTDPSSPDSDGDGLPDGEDDCATFEPDTGRWGGGEPAAPRLGGGCGGTGASWALLLLPLGLLARRRGLPLGLGLLALLGTQRVRAQELDVDSFRPAPGEPDSLALWDARSDPAGPSLSLLAHYARAPFVIYDGDEQVEALGHLFTTDLGLAYSAGTLRLAAQLPLHPLVAGDLVEPPTVLGDASAGLRLLLLDRLRSPLGLAVHAQGTLPTGNGRSWLGEGVPTFRGGLSLAAGHRWVGLLDLGYATASGVELPDLSWSGRPTAGLGLLHLAGDHLRLRLEAWAAWLAGNGPPTPSTLPAQWLGSLSWRTAPGWSLELGGGTALSPAVSTPRYRLLLGLGWRPRGGERARASPAADSPLPPDHDGDGIADPGDRCPDQPEDRNGRQDDDGCPEEGLTLLQVEAREPAGGELLQPWIEIDGQRFPLDRPAWTRALEPGHRELLVGASSHEAIPLELDLLPGSFRVEVLLQPISSLDQLPDRPERRAGFPKPSGDLDGDGIPNTDDRCPDQPEDLNGHQDQDGCPEGLFTLLHLELRTLDGQPEQARVDLLEGPVTGSWTVRGGLFEHSLLPGHYRVRATTDGLLPAEQDLEIPDGDEFSAALELRPPVALATYDVQVMDAKRHPLEASYYLSGPLVLRGQTSSEGSFHLELPRGTYSLRVWAPGYAADRRELVVATTAPIRSTVTLSPPLRARVDGDLLLPEGLIAFEPGSTAFAPTAFHAVESLADILHARPDILVVRLVGRPGPGSPGPSGLELAQAVARYLVEEEGFPPSRFVCVGAPEGSAPGDPPQVEARIAVRILP